MEHSIQEPSLRYLVGVLWNRRWAVTGIVTLTMLIALVYVFIVRDDLYMVSARVLVKIGREQAPPATVLGSGPQVIGYRSAEVNTETEIFQSRQLYEQLVADLGLDKPGLPPVPPAGVFQRVRFELKAISKALSDWKDELLIRVGLRPRLDERQKVIAQLQKSIVVEAATDSNVFIAVLSTPFRKGGAALLNHHIENYLRYRQKVYAENSVQLFVDEVERTTSQLDSMDKQLQEFENRSQITSYEKQKDVLVERLSQAQSAENDAGIVLRDIEGKVRRMEAVLRAARPNFGSIGDFPRESLPHNLLNQLAELDREREQLRLKELDSSDKIRNNREQFQVVAGMLEANLRALLEERRSQYGSRQKSREGIQRDLAGMHAAQVRWRDMKRQIADLENHNLFYRRKLEETRANDSMNVRELGNVVVIERPADPIQPVGIRKTALLEIALAVALVLGLAWITILEFFDTRVKSPEELERYMGKPVFAVLGERSRARFPVSKRAVLTDGTP
ncbi:MAG: hypothetical protein IT163_14170 [Bryobacterales bacterium]|nr:hypothetical protein [Bryobacterales bacterium]